MTDSSVRILAERKIGNDLPPGNYPCPVCGADGEIAQADDSENGFHNITCPACQGCGVIRG